MKHIIFTDPHIGMTLASHTTAASRLALKAKLYDQVGAAITAAADTLAEGEAANLICGGDLFHSFTNDESDILHGLEIARSCDILVAGNHDISNHEDKVSSLDLLEQTGLCKGIIRNVYGGYVAHRRDPFIVIPHCATQELFDLALTEAEGMIGHGNAKYLLLHCNYDSEFATSDISLNLTRKRAQQLLALGFTYIFLGHEHQPRVDLGGHLIILGNTHPTNFGDISDKFIYVLDDETNTLTSIPIWRQEQHFIEVEAEKFIKHAGDWPDQFVRVTGNVEPTELGEYTAAMKRAWKHFPNLFALRSDVIVRGAGEQADLDRQEFQRVTEKIEAELQDHPTLLALWNEIKPDRKIEAE